MKNTEILYYDFNTHSQICFGRTLFFDFKTDVPEKEAFEKFKDVHTIGEFLGRAFKLQEDQEGSLYFKGRETKHSDVSQLNRCVENYEVILVKNGVDSYKKSKVIQCHRADRN